MLLMSYGMCHCTTDLMAKKSCLKFAKLAITRWLERGGGRWYCLYDAFYGHGRRQTVLRTLKCKFKRIQFQIVALHARAHQTNAFIFCILTRPISHVASNNLVAAVACLPLFSGTFLIVCVCVGICSACARACVCMCVCGNVNRCIYHMRMRRYVGAGGYDMRFY